MRNLVTLSAAAIALGACASAPPSKPTPLAVQVESKQATVSKQDLTTAQLTVEADALAPVPGITAAAAHWELVFDGNVIARGEQQLGVPISNTAPTPLSLVGQGTVAANAQAVEKLSEHTGGFLIALRGTIDFAGPNGASGSEEFAKSTLLREPRMPTVTMADVGASHYDDGHVNLSFAVALDNANPFPVEVHSFKYTIAINDQPVANPSAGALEIPASSKRVLNVTEQLDPHTFKDLERIYRTNTMKYRLTGLLDVGLAKFDIDLGAPITFTR